MKGEEGTGSGPNAAPRLGPEIRRIPGWNAAHAILLRKNPSNATRPNAARQRRADSHLPQRPLWLCRTCAQPWPCGAARVRLIREYAHDRIALRIYLACQLHVAIADLLALDPHGAPTAEAFFARFLAWAAPRHNPPP